MSDDKIRCPDCRGATKVAKFRGMLSECETCGGSGKILASEKEGLKKGYAEKELLQAVAESAAREIEKKAAKREKTVKQALYKRKVSREKKEGVYNG